MIAVAMPAYNESKYLGSIIMQSKKYADKVIVVDDGSNDDTAEVSSLCGAIVISHVKRRGKGVAIQSIFNIAREMNIDILVILDSDSQHNPNEIPTLIKAINDGYDFVIGSRKVQYHKIPYYRRIGQNIISRFSRVLTKDKISDTESGFRAFSKRAILLMKLNEDGFAIEDEMIAEAVSNNLKIKEVDISAIYTNDGSTINPIKHGVGVVGRIILMISERRPLLFFGILGGLSTLLGIIAGVIVVVKFMGSGVVATGTLLASILLVNFGTLNVFTGIILNVLIKRLGRSK